MPGKHFRPVLLSQVDADPLTVLVSNVVSQAVADARNGDGDAADFLDETLGRMWRKFTLRQQAAGVTNELR